MVLNLGPWQIKWKESQWWCEKMKIPRKMHTQTYENGYCRIKINQETYTKFQSPSTVSIINP